MPDGNTAVRGIGMDKSVWQGNQGRNWAAEWRRTDRSFVAVTEKLLQRIRGTAFSQVLDVGCGAGELSLAIGRAWSDARVIGVDVSSDLVTVARQRGERLGNVGFDLADAAQWSPPPDFAPQLVVSRHGVMFFEDPSAAFVHLAAVADSGAQLLFSCFRTAAENPYFTEVARLLPEAPPPPAPGAPGPFSFGDRTMLAHLLAASGWESVAVDPFDFPLIVGAGEDPVEDAVGFFSAIGPSAAAAQAMGDGQRVAFMQGLRDLARSHRDGDLIAMPAAGWIVSARKA